MNSDTVVGSVPEFGWEAKKNPTKYKISKRIESLTRGLDRDYESNFQLIKMDVIDFAFEKLKITSVAELGCVWGVNGAYSRYIADTYSPERITMVDLIWNEKALELCNAYKEIETIQGNFTNRDIVDRIGEVDTVILFDLLLHMVNPNWDSVIEMYSKFTKSFLFVNPQYNSKITKRLWELPKEEFFDDVPHSPQQKSYVRAFENPWEFDESQQKIVRDAAYIWQWGITNSDLDHVMGKLGYELFLLKRGDIYYGKKKNFVDYGFVYVKSECLPDLLTIPTSI